MSEEEAQRGQRVMRMEKERCWKAATIMSSSGITPDRDDEVDEEICSRREENWRNCKPTIGRLVDEQRCPATVCRSDAKCA